jgi:DNA replication protein DnaC
MSLGNTVSTNFEQAGGLTRIDPVRDRPLLAQDSGLEPVPQADETVIQSNCSICGGTGWVKEAVPFGHPNFGVLFPCHCKQAEWARRDAEELARLSNLDAVRDKTFTTFNPFVPGLRELVPRIRSYARKPDGWLTLIGSYGVGKTHLAAAIANETLDRHEPVLFAVVPDLLDHLRATFGPQSTVAYDERFELVRTVPLLILDDLGAESATPWAREKLYQLINHRYNYRLSTVITTNLKAEAIEPRIYSRLCDPACGTILMVVAPDYRRRAAQKAD